MVVSNSSTLILIAKVTLLSDVLDYFKNITITKIVYEELTKKESFENMVIKKEIERGRIKIESVELKSHLDLIKQFKIDEGEASTFVLCKSKKYGLALTDDKELIKLCKIQDIKFTCALALAAILFKKRALNKDEALEKMEKLQGYGRYSAEIYNYFYKMVK